MCFPRQFPGLVRKTLILLYFFLSFSAHVIADGNDQSAESPIADVVWAVSQSNGSSSDQAASMATKAVRHRLMLSEFRANAWQDPVVVHQTKNFISSPVLITRKRSGKNQRILFWSEDIAGRTEILFKFNLDIPNNTWSPPKRVTGDCKECLAAAPIVDLNGVVWLFWSNNAQGHDDVYVSTLLGDEWAKPMLAHPENNVPDILPHASIDGRGQVELRWKSYSAIKRGYEAAVVLLGEAVEKPNLPGFNNDTLLQEISFPRFLPYNAPHFIHLPNNRFNQNLALPAR